MYKWKGSTVCFDINPYSAIVTTTKGKALRYPRRKFKGGRGAFIAP
jgi:hypothetical protein